MESPTLIRKLSLFAGTFAMAAVMSTSALAQHSGGGGGGHAGGGGGAHFSGGGHAGAYGGGHAGVYGGGYGGYRGGYYGGYRGGYGGYGWRGGYGGWRGGWGCCGWGWGWGGLGLGLYFATLPLYYETYWWNGVPYYYADNTYYTYDPNAKQYQTVAPPDGLQAQAGATGGGAAATGSELIAYPKNGQTAEQQSKDKYECHKWAVGQTGYDPTTGGAAPAAKRPEYMRAQAACLEGRGYSVE
jgi:hypothetical protein